LLLAKIATLKKGGYNLRTAELIISSIYSEIEKGTVTWQELKITKDEIDRLFFQVLKDEFVDMYLKYLNKELEIDELDYHFSLIEKAIRRSQLSFSELRPFDAQCFFQFRSHFNVKSVEEQNI